MSFAQYMALKKDLLPLC